MSHYYLVEDFDPALNYLDGEVISLTPTASYHLEKNRIPYRILDEFYSETELRKNEAAYFFDQLKWFGKFDKFLKENIDYCKTYQLEVARIFYHRLKYFIDSVIIQAFVLKNLVQKISSQAIRITYVKATGTNEDKLPISDFLDDRAATFFSKLILPITTQYDISVSFHEFGKAYSAGTLPEKANHRWIKNILKPFYRALRYKPLNPFRGGHSSPSNVLFVHSGNSHLDPVVTQLLQKNAHVFLLTGETIISINELFSQSYGIIQNVPCSQEDPLFRDCQKAGEKFKNDPEALLEWIDERAGVLVSPLIAAGFASFISNTCFDLLQKCQQFVDFYSREKIDYVITHTSADIISKSAILAAQISLKVKCVCIQHGCAAFDDATMQWGEIDPFDYYFAADSVSHAHFIKYAALDYVKPAVVLQASHYLQSFRDQSHRKNRKMGKRLKKRILYLPTKLSGHYRCFNNMVYPVLWYFEYQKQLMEYFAQKSGFEFIYKHMRTRSNYSDISILPYLQQRNYANIQIDSSPLWKWLSHDINGVLMDRPSTAFYEMAASGHPVLSLYPDFIEGVLSPIALKKFGKSLQAFSSMQEAFYKIDSFLNDPSEYHVELALYDDGLVDRLLKDKNLPNKYAEVMTVN